MSRAPITSEGPNASGRSGFGEVVTKFQPRARFLDDLSTQARLKTVLVLYSSVERRTAPPVDRHAQGRAPYIVMWWQLALTNFATYFLAVAKPAPPSKSCGPSSPPGGSIEFECSIYQLVPGLLAPLPQKPPGTPPMDAQSLAVGATPTFSS